MREAQPRVITVRHGEIEPAGSWLYIWVDASDGTLAYVGATGFDPELRAFLHLTSANPDVGRVRATVPQFAERDFDVLAFPLPADLSRPDAKQALISRLAELGYLSGSGTVNDTEAASTVDMIVGRLEGHLRELKIPGAG